MSQIIDIEVIPKPWEEILRNASPWSEEEALTRKGNRTKPETINAFLEDDKADYEKNLLEKASLDPATGIVAVVGMWVNGKVTQYTLLNHKEEMLVQFASNALASKAQTFGWNIHGYDLPFIVKKAWMFGIYIPSHVFNPIARYPIPDRIIDGMKVWQCGNYKAPFTSLDRALRSVGLPGKLEGSQFGKLWSEDPEKALAYNREELEGQAALYGKMGLL